MPHKIWVVGEEVLAAQFNQYVQEQVVATFANAAARTAAIAAPKVGQATQLADTGALEVWTDKTAPPSWRPPWSQPWGLVVPRTVVASLSLATGVQWLPGFPISFAASAIGRAVRFTLNGSFVCSAGAQVEPQVALQRTATAEEFAPWRTNCGAVAGCVIRAPILLSAAFRITTSPQTMGATGKLVTGAQATFYEGGYYTIEDLGPATGMTPN